MYLAIDQGTTSTRALLFDQQFELVSDARRSLQMFYPENGWVEQDPEQLWSTVVEVCREAVQKAGLVASDIAGIGITNQRETSVLWERKTGSPIAKAIVWQDRRTAKTCAEMKAAGYEEIVRQKTGLLLDPYFSGTKLRWLLRNIPGAADRAARGELAFGTVDSWLIYRMTGQHLTDATNASRTLLFNIHSQSWDEELLELFDIPANLLPAVLDCNADYGITDILGGETPICAVAGDQHAATIGQTCFREGMVKSTYGTGCFALINTGTTPYTSNHRLLTTPAYRINGETTFALEGSIFVAGAAVQWLRDEMKIIPDAASSEAMAKSVKNTGGVVVVPAFTGLGAPYWEPDARGAILGMTRNTNAVHIVRATLEAVAYQTQDLLQAMKADSSELNELRVDGGMVSNHWLMAFMANQLRIPVRVPSQMETTALGVAFLAAFQLGHVEKLSDLESRWRESFVFQPEDGSESLSRQRYQTWQKAVGSVVSSLK
jgi:glycerol kinase